MTRWMVMFLSLGSCALLQLLTPPWAVLGSVKIPFIVGAVVYYALRGADPALLVAGFMGGLLIDMMSPVPTGYAALVFCLAAWTMSRFRDAVHPDALVTPAVFSAAGAAATAALLCLLLGRAGLAPCSVWLLVWRAAGSALLGALSGPLVCAGVGALDRMVGNVEHVEPVDEME